jgi:hypothetical protein
MDVLDPDSIEKKAFFMRRFIAPQRSLENASSKIGRDNS